MAQAVPRPANPSIRNSRGQDLTPLSINTASHVRAVKPEAHLQLRQEGGHEAHTADVQLAVPERLQRQGELRHAAAL